MKQTINPLTWRFDIVWEDTISWNIKFVDELPSEWTEGVIYILWTEIYVRNWEWIKTWNTAIVKVFCIEDIEDREQIDELYTELSANNRQDRDETTFIKYWRQYYYLTNRVSIIDTLYSATAEWLSCMEIIYNSPDHMNRTGIETITVTTQWQQQADWNQTDTDAPDYIKNKPTIPAPFVQQQADWIQTNTSAPDYIKNRPSELFDPVSKTYVDSQLATKQWVLTPWTNITITNWVISASVEWALVYRGNVSDVTDLPASWSLWDCYYVENESMLYARDWTQWNPVWWQIDLTDYFNMETNTSDNITEWNNKLFVSQQEKDTWNGKQDTLTAGTGIDITNNVISNTMEDKVKEFNLTDSSDTTTAEQIIARIEDWWEAVVKCWMNIYRLTHVKSWLWGTTIYEFNGYIAESNGTTFEQIGITTDSLWEVINIVINTETIPTFEPTGTGMLGDVLTVTSNWYWWEQPIIWWWDTIPVMWRDLSENTQFFTVVVWWTYRITAQCDTSTSLKIQVNWTDVAEATASQSWNNTFTLTYVISVSEWDIITVMNNSGSSHHMRWIYIEKIDIKSWYVAVWQLEELEKQVGWYAFTGTRTIFSYTTAKTWTVYKVSSYLRSWTIYDWYLKVYVNNTLVLTLTWWAGWDSEYVEWTFNAHAGDVIRVDWESASSSSTISVWTTTLYYVN